LNISRAASNTLTVKAFFMSSVDDYFHVFVLFLMQFIFVDFLGGGNYFVEFL
jgi:hypothetical protein